MAQHPPPRLALGAWRVPLSAVLWCIVAGIALVPLANLCLKAGWESALDASGKMDHRWTGSRFAQTLIETGTLFGSEFRWSATLAVVSSTVALGLAILFRWLGRSSTKRRMINGLCLILISVPGPLVAALITQLFLSRSLPGLAWLYDHTLLAPVLAQQTRLFPLAWLIVGGILSTISAQAWELAAVDQLPAWSQIRMVIWRPTWRLWLAAWLLLAAMSAGELSTHLLLLPPGVTTVAQRLFEFLHFGMRYQDSGLCLALVALGWLVAIVVWNTRTGRA